MYGMLLFDSFSCGLYELDGILFMLSLKELYLLYNEICDISVLSMLDLL